MTQDYYEILQVHPKADADAIQAAYERLCGLYDPAKLAGVAEELVEIARRKRASIEEAYTVLSDPQQRSAYDSSKPASTALAADGEQPVPAQQAEAMLDYRPLPPARRAERSNTFDTAPLVAAPIRKTTPTTAIIIAFVLLASISSMSLLITNWGVLTATSNTAQAVETPTASVLDQYEIDIAAARKATEQNPNDAQAWISLGNVLYDSAQIVRENMPESTLYQQRLPRWLEASQAYDRALALQPDNASALADKGTSLCYYGAGTGDLSMVATGIEDTRNAASARPQDPLIQLNLGICLVSAQPPQTQDALAAWQTVTQIAPADSPITQRAQELIAQYQKKP